MIEVVFTMKASVLFYEPLTTGFICLWLDHTVKNLIVHGEA
jgi:hypothetical protein